MPLWSHFELGRGGFNVKRVMVDQRSGVEIIYLDLYKGLSLKPEDLSKYDVSLVRFHRKVLTSKRMINLPVQTGNGVVELDFIVMDDYSPYTAILARPWLYTMGAISSTLHVEVKYSMEGVSGNCWDAKLWLGSAWL